MHYVYLIQGAQHPERFYAGQTENLKQRLAEHNAGKLIYTQRHKPGTSVWVWRVWAEKDGLGIREMPQIRLGKDIFTSAFALNPPRPPDATKEYAASGPLLWRPDCAALTGCQKPAPA